jgi:hypothetical protein
VFSKSRIFDYEQRLRRIGLEEVQALAKALGTVSAAYLLCLDGKEILSAEELGLVRRFRATDASGQQFWVSLRPRGMSWAGAEPFVMFLLVLRSIV